MRLYKRTYLDFSDMIAYHADMGKLLTRYHSYLLGTLFALALFAVYYAVAGGVTHNGDNASVLLEAHAMATGNLLLRHWSMPSDSFISSDIRIYALFERVVGIAPGLMRLVPAILFTLVMLLSCWFASWGLRGRASYLAILLTIAIIGTPSMFLANEALLGPIHMGTILFVLLAYVAYLHVFHDAHHPVRAGIWLVVFMVLTSAATLGDPLTLLIELLPILVLSGAHIYATRKAQPTELLVMGASLGAYALARGMNMYLIQTGTHIAQTSFVFISAAGLASNLTQTVEAIVALFGADFFGNPLFRLGMLRTLLHLGACASALIALLAIGKRLASGLDITHPQTRLEALLWQAAFANVLAFAFSSYPGGDITNARYLLPFFFFSGILGARVVTQFVVHDRLNTLLAVMFAVVILGAFARDIIVMPQAQEPERAVVSLLESQGVASGYGQYWGSAIITVYAHGAVPIRQITPSGSGVAPDFQLADESWYQGNQHARVVITSDFYTPAGFMPATVRAFGPYAKEYTIAPYHVYVWERELPQVH